MAKKERNELIQKLIENTNDLMLYNQLDKSKSLDNNYVNWLQLAKLALRLLKTCAENRHV